MPTITQSQQSVMQCYRMAIGFTHGTSLSEKEPGRERGAHRPVWVTDHRKGGDTKELPEDAGKLKIQKWPLLRKSVMKA